MELIGHIVPRSTLIRARYFICNAAIMAVACSFLLCDAVNYLNKLFATFFSAIIFYDQLLSYLLSEEQLTTNGYPRPSDHVGVALINVERQLEPLPEPLPGNGQYQYLISIVITCTCSIAVRHYCCRCRKPFIIYNNGSYQTVEECVYHYGKLYKSRGERERMREISCILSQNMERAWSLSIAVVVSEETRLVAK